MALNNSSPINKNPENIHILSQDTYKIFGTYWNKTSSPTMTRTDDAVGLTSSAGVDNQLIQNDFDHMPIYRDMIEIKDSYGNSFIQIPKFYIQRKVGKGFLQVRISKTKHPGFYLPKVFWDHVNQKELPYYLHGACLAGYSADETKLESKKGFDPKVGNSINFVRARARANNANGLKGYQLHDIHSQDVISTLWHIEHATLDSRLIMKGAGNLVHPDYNIQTTVAEAGARRVILANANADTFVVGQTLRVAGVSVGQVTEISIYDSSNKALSFSGAARDVTVGQVVASLPWKSGFSRDVLPSNGSIVSNIDDKHPCVYRGIESPWSDCEQWVDGVYFKDGELWVSENPDDYGTIVNYKKLGYMASNNKGWITDLGYDFDYPYAQLPTACSGGSSSTFFSDDYSYNIGTRVATTGGAFFTQDRGGINRWWFGAMETDTGAITCGRLIKKAIGE